MRGVSKARQWWGNCARALRIGRRPEFVQLVQVQYLSYSLNVQQQRYKNEEERVTRYDVLEGPLAGVFSIEAGSAEPATRNLNSAHPPPSTRGRPVSFFPKQLGGPVSLSEFDAIMSPLSAFILINEPERRVVVSQISPLHLRELKSIISPASIPSLVLSSNIQREQTCR
jgi:hypothetical protein